MHDNTSQTKQTNDNKLLQIAASILVSVFRILSKRTYTVSNLVWTFDVLNIGV